MVGNAHHALQMTNVAHRIMRYALRLSYLSPSLPLFWLVIAVIPGLFYLAVAGLGYGYAGFPLDDAWIHQTYARNLAQTGQLAFVPGISSAGSTAPLWTLLLSAGYLLGIPFNLWTNFLGIGFLGLTGWSVNRLGKQLFPQSQNIGLWAGLFCLFEWHLVWAAVSGMETILFVWLSVFLVERYGAVETIHAKNYVWWHAVLLGVLGGLLILTRPEGAGLVGLLGLDMALRRWRQTGNKRIADLMKRWGGIAIGVSVLLFPYIAFHLYLTGLPFPNTFYAKQAEYSVILETFPLWWRLFGNIGSPIESVQGVFSVIFIGPQILLLPGLAYAAWRTVKEKRLNLWIIWVWWVSYLLLYGLRLPVTYQHGRYQIPAIVWVVLLGMWGTVLLVSRQRQQRMLQRVLGRALVVSLALLLLLFTVVGARAYARDVRFIESEMVRTARWINTHTNPDALIAAHDIGAIGYFSRRPLIDLAGLVTPEVIPIIRDETALFQFMRRNKAEYLVTFPSWYPDMIRNTELTLVYRTSTLSPQAGIDNMVVYEIVDGVGR